MFTTLVVLFDLYRNGNRYAFIGFSLVEVSGLIGLVISLLLLFGFDGLPYPLISMVNMAPSSNQA